jgi:hypothetical protein
MNANKPILVTGSHHSGTTWVGKMIAASPSVGYIHEPFNPIHRLGMCSANFEQWFYYINSENAASYYSKFKDTVEFKYNLLAQLTDPNLSRGFKVAIYNYRQAIKDYQVFQRYRLLKKRPLLKDPIAIFSAEWLAETFDMDVVVLVRHPAAFISSLKRQNEAYPFSHFLQQPLLMRDHLYLFEEQIREYSKEERSIIDQGILLWKIIHQVIINYQAKHENWLFLRHEDISRSPLDYFQRIFEKLGLMFQDEVKECIENYSKHSNPKAAPDNSSSIKLDSKANIWNWKTRLTEEEISYIRSQLKGIAEKFYCDTDW